MTLGDRVAVVRDGVLQQCATPDELFRSLANLFVAGFIGSPAMNFAEGVVDTGQVAFAGWRVPVAPGIALAAAGGRRVIVGVRPHDRALAGPGRAARGCRACAPRWRWSSAWAPRRT